MTRQRRSPIGGWKAAAVAAAVLAGCTGGGSAPATSGPSGSAVTPQARLASEVRRALLPARSAAVLVDAAGLGARASGVLALSDGRTTASRLRVVRDSRPSVPVITVGRDGWARLPTVGSARRPWVVLRPGSSHPTARALVGTVRLVTTLTALRGFADAAGAASSLTPVPAGSGTVYRLILRPAALHDSLGAMLQLTNPRPVALRLQLDAAQRPRRVDFTTAVAGVARPITVRVTGYDLPTAIAAPPPQQVTP